MPLSVVKKIFALTPMAGFSDSPGAIYPALRKLERNNLVERRVLATAPAGVEYRLTQLGQSLLGPVSVLARWAEEHADDLAGDDSF